MYKVFYLADATRGASCGVIRWDVEPWTITSERSGEVIPASQILEFLDRCTERGVHAGRNERAFRQSRSDAQEFVRGIVFSGSSAPAVTRAATARSALRTQPSRNAISAILSSCQPRSAILSRVG